VSEPAPYVVETVEDFAPDTLFVGGRAHVIDDANARGYALARELPFRDEWLICVFEAFDEEYSPPAT
jgi:hypothetical protein